MPFFVLINSSLSLWEFHTCRQSVFVPIHLPLPLTPPRSTRILLSDFMSSFSSVIHWFICCLPVATSLKKTDAPPCKSQQLPTKLIQENRRSKTSTATKLCWNHAMSGILQEKDLTVLSLSNNPSHPGLQFSRCTFFAFFPWHHLSRKSSPVYAYKIKNRKIWVSLLALDLII